MKATGFVKSTVLPLTKAAAPIFTDVLSAAVIFTFTALRLEAIERGALAKTAVAPSAGTVAASFSSTKEMTETEASEEPLFGVSLRQEAIRRRPRKANSKFFII